MYRGDDGRLILDHTDLVGHLACGHLTDLELRTACGELVRPAPADPQSEVVRRRRLEHKAAVVARWRSEGRSIVEIPPTVADGASSGRAVAATVAALAAGADVVVHAAFEDGRWRAGADLLLRVEGGTALGPWGYEAVELSLARRVKPEAVLRLASASAQLERVQCAEPEHLSVITADGTRHRYRVSDAAAYHRTVAGRLQEAVTARQPPPYPEEVPHCSRCPWALRCEARRRADGHLSLVAGMRRQWVPAWAAIGVTTVAALAEDPLGTPVPTLPTETADRLRRQAQLQVRQMADGRVRYELLPVDERGFGLASLPEPSPGDLFFDIEGDPWVGEHGLEYLFGLVEQGAAGPVFSAFWAHTPEGERAAFERVVDLVAARRRADPTMHVYHFAPYEVAVMRDLAGRYGTRQSEVDELLEAEVFVDLYAVVRGSVRISQEGYGLKRLEPLYLEARDGAINDGGTSIVAYEEWLSTGEQQLLDDIAAYNEVDCRSTLGLRDWLEERRAELERQLGHRLPRPPQRDRVPAAEPDRPSVGAPLALERRSADDEGGAGKPTVELLATPPAGTRPSVAEGPLVSGSGVRVHLAPHEGNRTRSEEEAVAVAELVGALVGRSWTDATGAERQLRLDDVIVTAPFDDQVSCLARVLPEGARVVTTDEVEGVEAPVVICSLAASSAADVPWGAEPSFSHRLLDDTLTVGRALAVVVTSPSLLGSACRTIGQLRLVNALCQLTEETPEA